MEKPVENLSAAPVENSAAPVPLAPLPVVVSRFVLPPDYTKARELFDLAVTNYEDGEPAVAAPRFIKVAMMVRTNGDTTYAEGFRKMREVSYQNAATAYRAAKMKKEGAEALTKAAKEDKENSAMIEALAKTLK